MGYINIRLLLLLRTFGLNWGVESSRVSINLHCTFGWLFEKETLWQECGSNILDVFGGHTGREEVFSPAADHFYDLLNFLPGLINGQSETSALGEQVVDASGAAKVAHGQGKIAAFETDDGSRH